MMITRGYGPKAKAIVTRGITWLGEVLYSVPRCFFRRQPIQKIVSADRDIAVRKAEQQRLTARAGISKVVRKQLPANRIARRTAQDLIFRDVKPCRT